MGGQVLDGERRRHIERGIVKNERVGPWVDLLVVVGIVVFLVGGAIDLIGGHPQAGQIGEGALIVAGVEWWVEEYVSRARRVVRRVLGTRQRRLLNGPGPR